MKRAPRPSMLAALLAAMALVLQWASPMPAMAGHHLDGQTIELCTAEGLQAVQIDGGGPERDGGHGCGHCCLATPAAGPAPSAVSNPLAYGHASGRLASTQQPAPHGARAPPRPPGQAPPIA